MAGQPVPFARGTTVPGEVFDRPGREPNQSTVVVLGAGFTRAFQASSPLLRDHYDLEPLLKKYGSFEYAERVLKLAVNDGKAHDGRIDLERVMTRLDGHTPYDYDHGALDVLRSLSRDVKAIFVERLRAAKGGATYHDELDSFAKYCVTNRVSCITFNYDDVFDAALERVVRVHVGSNLNPFRWHPNSGYGFYCKPSSLIIEQRSDVMEISSMLMLKLHGSVNWRAIKGTSQPYGLGALFHHEEWHSPHYEEGSGMPLERIEPFLEPEPFIVPPVLVKSPLVQHPVLRHLWSSAFEVLSAADEVIFLGYSLPLTDIAAGFLFSESLRDKDVSSMVTIVVLPAGDDEGSRQELIRAYRHVFPALKDEAFHFGDAREWCTTRAAGDG